MGDQTGLTLLKVKFEGDIAYLSFWTPFSGWFVWVNTVIISGFSEMLTSCVLAGSLSSKVDHQK